MLEHLVAGALAVSLLFYALTGGADFGGGVWDILASGPRAQAQRKLIARAIGPIWEANHVWLILAYVLLFAAFPRAAELVLLKLHVPLTIMLVGIVLRGAAFTFRTYDKHDEGRQQAWGRAFSLASIATPVLLGATVGAVASGKLDDGLIWCWVAPFPLAVGVLALACFAYLGACYLAHEATEPDLRDDFRKRAIGSGLLVAAMGIVTFGLSRSGAPVLWNAFWDNPGAWGVPLVGFGFGAAALVMIRRGRVALGRVLAAAEVATVLAGWALAQYPRLVVPGPTITEAAAPQKTLGLIVVALGLGALILFPALAYLFFVFKGKRAFQVIDE